MTLMARQATLWNLRSTVPHSGHALLRSSDTEPVCTKPVEPRIRPVRPDCCTAPNKDLLALPHACSTRMRSIHYRGE